ncbi:MAG: nucleoside hydrolase, partial [Bacteroidota bacterium]
YNAQSQKQVILDADTGNEVDDLYAIVRALIEPSWDIIALNGTQWQASHWAVDNSMEESHRLNQVLVSYLEMENEVPTLRGGNDRMYDWGDMAQHSAATYEIIKQARRLPEGEKIPVIALGALTNVASAIYIAPDIENKIEVYWLGTSYNFETNTSKRTDFNAIMDVQATEIMLSSQVTMHIIPVNVAGKMTFDFEETKNRLQGIHPLADYIIDRWYNHLDGGRYQRTIWDLALISIMIFPEWTEEVKTESFENKNTYLYKDIDANAIREEFFNTTTDYLKKLQK